MSTITLVPTAIPVEIDPEIAEDLADDILAGVARETKVAKVKATGRQDFMQSHTARAWSRSGNVD